MAPTATATLGVKGHRPVVGTWDCKDLLYVFAVVNLLSGAIHSNTLESRKDAKKKTGKSKTRRLQEAFAQHLRHVGRIYPQDKHKGGGAADRQLASRGTRANRSRRAWTADNPHLVFKRLPSYSPQLNPIERLWKVLRRRSTHNRLFDNRADLKGSIRNGLRYFQTMRARVKTLLNARKKGTGNRTVS